jgi:hypothetical protein
MSEDRIRLGIPAEDTWVYSQFAQIVADRLARRSDVVAKRISLLRLLWTLQRLPYLQRGVNIGLSTGREIQSFEFKVGSDGLRFCVYDEGTTVFELDCAAGGVTARALFQNLEGNERTAALDLHVESFRYEVVESEDELYIEDYSQGVELDQVPMWLQQ